MYSQLGRKSFSGRIRPMSDETLVARVLLRNLLRSKTRATQLHQTRQNVHCNYLIINYLIINYLIIILNSLQLLSVCLIKMSIKWRLSAVIMQWRPIRPETAGERSIGENTSGQRVTRA